MTANPTDQRLAYKQRLVFSLLRAAARVGLRLGMPMKQMRELLFMAYFREAREEQGLKLDEIARLFDKSLRTVSSLNHRFRGDFFVPEDSLALRRAIAALVNHAPASRDRLATTFSETTDPTLDAALADLVEAGTLILEDGDYRRNPDAHSFITGDDLHNRVDGLNRQMDVLAATVWNRFVSDQDTGGARTLVFRATDGDFTKLVAALETWLTEHAVATDAAAENTPEAATVGITFAATQMEES